jgi:hypothetical protein
MRVAFRRYNRAADYERVGQFLVRTYRTTGGHVNWLQPRWEYMHYHPMIRDVDLNAIGVWEAQAEITAVVRPEHAMGTAYFEIHPDHGALEGELLRYAEGHLSTLSYEVRRPRVCINDQDNDLQRVASEMGYARGRLPCAAPRSWRQMSQETEGQKRSSSEISLFRTVRWTQARPTYLAAPGG